MEFDIWTILTVLIALLVGVLCFYIYNNQRNTAVDEVFKTVKTIFDSYGEDILKDNPQLYSEVKTALDAMSEAMGDEEITLVEAFEIVRAYIPLSKRLTTYVKEHYA